MNDASLSMDEYNQMRDKFEVAFGMLDGKKASIGVETMKYKLRALVDEAKCRTYFFPVTHHRGWHLWIDNVRPVPVRDFVKGVNTAIDNMRLGIASGKTHHLKVVKIILTQCKSQMLKYSVSSRVVDAYKKLTNFLEKEYSPHCRSKIGWSCMTSDDDEYETYIRNTLGISMDAVSIFREGVYQLEKTISKIILLVKDEDYLKHLKKNYPSKPVKHWIKDHIIFQKKYIVNHDKHFTSVSTKTPFEVNIVEDKHMSVARYTLKDHGGVMDVNMTCSYPACIAPSLFAHEVCPGHHLEVCHNTEKWAGSDQLLLSYFAGYVEGWAFYSEEHWCKNMTERSKVGQLFMEAVRDLRLILDTGIHSKRCGQWTMTECTKFMSTGIFRGLRLVDKFKGLGLNKQAMRAEVVNMSVKPGYVLSYKIGKLHFDKVYERAKEAGYSRTEIHDRFLSRRVPLNLLERLFEKKPMELKIPDNSLTLDLSNSLSPVQKQMFFHQLSSCSCA